MSERSYKNWFIPIDRNFTIEDIVNRGGFYDIDGVWNSILRVDGELLRGRVEVLILDGDKIFLQLYDDGTYRIPGGSFEKGVFNKDQAAAEAKEEARILCKNVTYSGVNYIRFFDKKYKQEPGRIYWAGTYNEVYVAEYDGQYHGRINEIDRDYNMYTQGKFYPLSMVANKLKAPHQEALKDIIKDVMISQSYSTSISANIQESTKKIPDDDNFFHLTPIEENTITKKENIKYYPYFTPKQMESIGVFRESGNFYSDTAEIDNYTKDWYRRYRTQNDLSVSSDWYAKLKQEYDHYRENPSNEAKQKVLSLGWNPEVPVTIENIKKVADLREKENTPEKVIKLQENYIFSKKDNVYNFDKWENGECNILFITGHSGSGKSTLAFQLAKEYGATVIQLDHIQCYEKFMKCHKQSDTTKLIKKYLKKNKDLKASDFDNILLKSFQEIYNEMFPWLLKELEKDKDTLYIIEGVHIMLFTKYKDIKEYPLICINTSMSKSMFRHWVRDQFTLKELIMYGPADIVLFKNWEDQYNDFKNDIENESYIINPKEDDNMIQESISSTVSKDYKPKGKKSLSSFQKIKLNKNVISQYKNKFPALRHIRENCDGYLYLDKDKCVAVVAVEDKGDHNFIQAIEITKEYQGYGLSKQLLSVAVKGLDAKKLSVNKKNKLAIDIYRKFGFKQYDETDSMIFMSVNESANNDHYDIRPTAEKAKEIIKKYHEKDMLTCIHCRDIEWDDESLIFAEYEINNDIDKEQVINFINYINELTKTTIYRGEINIPYLKNKGLLYISYNESSSILDESVIEESDKNSGYKYRKLTGSNDIDEFFKYNKELLNDDTRNKEIIDKCNIKKIYFRNKFIGYIGLTSYHSNKDNMNYLRIRNFMILPEYQKMGHGTNIINDIVEKNKEKYNEIFCWVEKDNAEAIKFYQKIADVDTRNLIKNKLYYVRFYYNYQNESVIEEEMKRSKLPDDVFGIPQERKYPMPDEKHVRSAIKLFNYVEPKYEKQLAKKIIVNMKKYNIDASMVGDKNRLKQYLPKTMLESSSNHRRLYHLSQTNLDGKTLSPRIPSNYFTQNGYEDKTTKRVCFTPSIDKALRALSKNCTGIELYVHIPYKEYPISKPTTKQVPDCKVTGELWIIEPVKLKCIGKIKVLGDKGEDGLPFTYGDKTAELYDWDWRWIEKF